MRERRHSSHISEREETLISHPQLFGRLMEPIRPDEANTLEVVVTPAMTREDVVEKVMNCIRER